MKLMPSSRVRRSTRIASSWSAGGPQMPGPVIRIAPKPEPDHLQVVAEAEGA